MAELGEFAKGVPDEHMMLDSSREEFELLEAEGFEMLSDTVPDDRNGGTGFRRLVVVFIEPNRVRNMEGTLLPVGQSGRFAEGCLGGLRKVDSYYNGFPRIHLKW